jgi:penicillin-binding protein 2
MAGKQNGIAQSRDNAPAANAPSPRGRILDRNGVVLADNDAGGARVYPWGALASHVLGYASRAGQGRTGAEAQFQKALSAGKDVSLTLDVRLQLILENSLAEAGVGRGAGVLLDPQDGSILAMASVPNFDPAIFADRLRANEVESLVSDQTQPTLNRAIVVDTPGSVYKVVTAVAACRAGKGGMFYSCPGFIDYGRPISCWIYTQQHSNHGGPFGLAEALRNSCNCWFFQAGNAAGIDTMAETARLMGLEGAARDFDESRPVMIPDRKWWAENRPGPWTPSETAYASVGTGLIQQTPLHMASVAATVGGGGAVWAPRLAADTPVLCTQKEILPLKQMDPIRRGMWEAVNHEHGIGKRAHSNLFEIAGTTGTAPKLRKDGAKIVDDNRAWFISFAPFEKPRFALSITVANGKAGGAVCAPISKNIFERAMALPADRPALVPEHRAPVEGHFRLVEGKQ